MRPKARQKQIWITGTGNGSRRLLTRQASAALTRADVLIAPSSLKESVSELTGGRSVPVLMADGPKAIREAVDSADVSTVAVLMPGDPGDDPSLPELIRRLADLKPVVFPGISFSSYLSSRCGVSYQDALTVDLSEGDANVVPLLKKYGKLFLTGTEHLENHLKEIHRAGYGHAIVYAGTHLGFISEGIRTGTCGELKELHFAEDTVCFILLPPGSVPAETSYPEYAPSSDPASLSAEAEAVMRMKLAIRRDDIVYVIGDTDGRLTCDAACDAEVGHIYSITETQSAAERILDHTAFRGVHNVHVLQGHLPAALRRLPDPDAVIAVGAEEVFGDVLQISLSRNPEVRTASCTRILEAASKEAGALEARAMNAEIVQIGVTRLAGGRSSHRASSEDPVWLLFGRKDPDGNAEG